ncbi:MAG TPA: hypothetical protein VMV49_16665 [Candidatus Deferrimicrobium sp.]|nr:hypothetical protein [Candidatus Deferrimicrobium sp.]
MEVLDLKPIIGKKIFVFLIRKENGTLDHNEELILANVLQTYHIKFATINIESDEIKGFKHTDMAKFLNDFMVPCYTVGIPEYAKGYLDSEISEKKEQAIELEAEYKAMKDKQSFKAQNLKSWIALLFDEIKEKEEFMRNELTSQWIAKKITDILRYYDDETIYTVHFAPAQSLLQLRQIFKELGMYVISGEIGEKLLTPFPLNENLEAS